MSDGKWVSSLKADLPLAEAAGMAIAARTKPIRKYLPLALSNPDRNLEYIHQLRVGTRRAGAVLSEFEDCWSDKFLEKLRKNLKRLRQAAGAARDWDVMSLSLAERRQQVEKAEWVGIDYLLGFAHGERQAAQRDLEKVARHLDVEALNDLWELAEAAAREPRRGTKGRKLIDLARERVPQHFKDLHELASGDLTNLEHLHEVRIQGKRLRYSMELFADCFKPKFKKEVYPAIEEMQEILGHVNDSHVALDRLHLLGDNLKSSDKAEWSRVRRGFEALEAYHHDRLESEQVAFIRWWQHWQLLDASHRVESLFKKS